MVVPVWMTSYQPCEKPKDHHGKQKGADQLGPMLRSERLEDSRTDAFAHVPGDEEEYAGQHCERHAGRERRGGRRRSRCGNVVIQRKDGNRLETPQLVFDNARNQIYSDSSFTWTNPKKDILTGIGFESDPKMTNLRCMRSCKGKASVRISRQ